MNKIKAIIVDDERLARVNLRNMLETFPTVEIVGEANNCMLAIKLIENYTPQLIFLDIQLKGETGFDLLEQINSKIHIVFVTAFDAFAIRAFEVNAIDYLLKPINTERLAIAIDRIISSVKPEVPKKFNYDDSIYVKLSSQTSKFVKIQSIVYIVPVGNHTKLFIKNEKKCVVLKTLKKWEEELPTNKFVRIHRSTLINIEYVERIEKYRNQHHNLYLQNIAEPFEISRRNLKNLRGI